MDYDAWKQQAASNRVTLLPMNDPTHSNNCMSIEEPKRTPAQDSSLHTQESFKPGVFLHPIEISHRQSASLNQRSSLIPRTQMPDFILR